MFNTLPLSIELDPHPFDRWGTYPIVIVSGMHVLQAIITLLWPNGGGATCLLSLLEILHDLRSPDGAVFMAFVMLLTAGLAMVGAFCRVGWIRLSIFLPQHFVLGAMTWGMFQGAWNGSYLDGTVIPWPHIINDQLPILGLFIVHSFAILQRSRDPLG